VKITAGVLAYCSSTDLGLGTLEQRQFATTESVNAPVRLHTAQGTRKVEVSEAIGQYQPCYAAANGRVASTGTILRGFLMQAATAEGDVVEMQPVHNNDVSTSIAGTTNATFDADTDLGKPRAGLGSQTGGTGDFAARVLPPATLTGNRTFTLAGDANDTLLGLGTAATITAVHTFGAGFLETPDSVTPAADGGAGSQIPVGAHAVVVGAVTNNADDWILLPAIASVPLGHTIRILCNAGGNFELRTPAASNTKINDVDADGTQEYLCTDTDMVVVTKRATDNWVAQSITKLGAVRTAVVPD